MSEESAIEDPVTTIPIRVSDLQRLQRLQQELAKEERDEVSLQDTLRRAMDFLEERLF